MKDQSKTKQSLIQELASLREKLTELEKSEAARKRAEAALRQSEDQLRTIIEGTQALLVSVDADGRLTYANDATAEALGYKTAAEIIGRLYLDFVHSDDRRRVLNSMIHQAEASQSSSIQEFRVVDTKGQVKWFSFISTMVSRDGKFVGMTGVAQNITERKQAEDALRKSEARYRTFFEHAAVGVAEIEHVTGRFLTANPRLCELLGRTEEEMRDTTFQAITHPDDLHLHEEKAAQLLAGTIDHYTLEKRCISKDGAIIWVNITVSDTRETGETHGRNIVIVEDITERKRTEAALQASEEKFRQIVSSIPNIVAILDMNLRFTYVSASVQRILGYTPEEAMTMTLEQICTPESLAIAFKSFQERLEANAKVPDPNYVLILELEEYHKNGSTVILENTTTFLRDANGVPVGILCVAADITERTQAEEALRESEEKYKFLVENTNDIIWVFDLKTMSYSFCSSSVERILGFTADETVGMKLDDIFSPEAKKTVQAAFWKIVAGKEPSDRVMIEVEHIAKNGSRLWMEINAVEKGTNLANRWLSMVRHVTSRPANWRRMNCKLRNILLSTQQEVSIDGILVVDENGTIISFNRRFVEIWAIPNDVVESKSDERALQSVMGNLVDPDEFIAKVRHLYENRSETSRDEIALKDGRILDRYSAPMLGDDGKYYGRIWYFRDITKRKRSEQALYESERRLADIINFLPIATMVIDREGKITAWNRAMEAITGVKREDMIGKGDYEYALPFYKERRPILIDRVFDTDKEIETHYTNMHL